MSSSSEKCYIAYPAPSIVPSSKGSPNPPSLSSITSDVMIFDANTCEAVSVIQAHKGPVSCLAINSEGSLLATSSEKGTVIRIFSIQNSTKIAQLRRGSYSAHIYNMTFNARSTLLCVSSDTDTLHIFKVFNNKKSGSGKNKNNKGSSSNSPPIQDNDQMGPALSAAKYGLLDDGNSNQQTFLSENSTSALTNFQYENNSLNEPSSNSASGSQRNKDKGTGSSWRGIMGSKLVGKAASLMPGSISEIWEPSRDFAHIKLPKSGIQSIAAVSTIMSQVIVITSEGFVYLYNIDLNEGGECILLKQYSLHDGNNDIQANAT
ncbi:hypothetical protein BB559_005071 [Furculomyces boomerangus]|uniref:Autophagy-related protein 18 n=2 Tax=Harpellales TaxID=61421 RepID=A0A2T9YB49_9FUNG|nr:hypothetical protein BB559_005071 [Furculomyces boomerangus]PWA00053.1 hypothetical protein BB558_003911 [Smittium angustum]